MSTTLPVAYSHLIEGFDKGIDRSGGPFYRVIYKIDDWSKTDDFCNALMGAGSITGPVTGGTITRVSPHQHPLSKNLFCISATVVQGLGNPVLNSNGYPDYDGGALIAAEYRCLTWDAITPDLNNSFDSATPLTYCTQELDFSTDTFTLANSKLTYSSGPHASTFTTVHTSYQVPITHMTLTYHKTPFLPMTVVRNLRGRVNNGLFLGAPAECVLLKGVRTRREFNTDGTVIQEVQVVLEERNSDQGWNSLPSDDDPTFYPVAGAGGVKMFKLGDFSPLLQF